MPGRKSRHIFCFLDYIMAFDTIQHKPLMQLLNNKGIDTRDFRMINKLYNEQEATVRINGSESCRIKIKRGEEVINKALENETAGIKINGHLISNIRYADDTVLITEKLKIYRDH